MLLETKRLILRKWRLEDAPSMFLYASNPDVGPKAGWPPHRSVKDSETIISHFLDHHPYAFAICLKEDIEHPIGTVELKVGRTDLVTTDDEAEIGYWLGKPFWGNEYMKEAGEALIEYGFDQLGFSRIWAGYYEGNLQSRRVQEKIGFVYHHQSDHLYVHEMDEYRTGHVTLLTKERFQMLHHR